MDNQPTGTPSNDIRSLWDQITNPGSPSLQPLKDPPTPNTFEVDKKPGENPLSERRGGPSDRANFETHPSSRGPLPSEAIFVRCPFCDDDCVHLEAARINRGGEITEVNHHGTDIRSWKTSGRGARLDIIFWCEQGHTWERSLQFSKGNVYQEDELLFTTELPGALNNDLWRD